MSDWQNPTAAKQKSNLFIMSMITNWIWTKSHYQLIKTMTTFEKETRHWLHVFIKKRTVDMVKCKTTVHACDAFCPLPHAWHVNCPLNVLLYTPMSYSSSHNASFKNSNWISISSHKLVDKSTIICKECWCWVQICTYPLNHLTLFCQRLCEETSFCPLYTTSSVGKP